MSQTLEQKISAYIELRQLKNSNPLPVKGSSIRWLKDQPEFLVVANCNKERRRLLRHHLGRVLTHTVSNCCAQAVSASFRGGSIGRR